MDRRSFLVACAVASATLISCTPERSAPAPTPRTVGSVSRIRVSGSGTALPAVQKLAEEYARLAPDARVEIAGGTNSGGAIRGVLERSLDVAVTNRPLTAAEAREPLVYVPFVRDAVTFAVHRSVAIRGVRSDQVRDLYGGLVTSWRGLGGPDAPVIILDRDEDESMRKLALIPLLGGHPVTATAVVLTSATDMLSALDTTPHAIGYTSFGLLRMRAPKQVEPLALDDVMPGPDAVAAGTYPLSLTFGLVLHADPAPATREFVAQAVRSTPTVLGPYGFEHIHG